MSTLRNVLAGLLMLCLAFGGGYLLRGCRGATEGPTAKEEGPVREKIVYKPGNCDEAWKCYYSTLFIRAAFKKRDLLTITAGTMCKESEQDFKIICPELSVPNHWQIQFMALGGYDKMSKRVDALAGGSLGYIKGMGRVGLGVSAVYLKGLISDSHYGGAAINVQY